MPYAVMQVPGDAGALLEYRQLGPLVLFLDQAPVGAGQRVRILGRGVAQPVILRNLRLQRHGPPLHQDSQARQDQCHKKAVTAALQVQGKRGQRAQEKEGMRGRPEIIKEHRQIKIHRRIKNPCQQAGAGQGRGIGAGREAFVQGGQRDGKEQRQHRAKGLLGRVQVQQGAQEYKHPFFRVPVQKGTPPFLHCMPFSHAFQRDECHAHL